MANKYNNYVATEKFVKEHVDDIVLQNQSDWQQSDCTQKNYIKNRTHYDDELILLEGNISRRDQIDGCYPFNEPINLNLDEEYVIIINGTKYTNTAIFDDTDVSNCVHLKDANGDMIGCVYGVNNSLLSNGYVWIINEPPSRIYVKIIKYELKKIDTKYLPDVAVTCNTAKIGQIIRVKAVNDSGIPVEWEAVDGQTSQNYLTLIDESTGYGYSIFLKDGEIRYTIKVSSLTITSLPNKTDYRDTELFDPTGMIITATLQDGSFKDITDLVEYDRYVTTGSSGHIISYNEHGQIITTEVPIITRSIEDALVDFTYTVEEDGTYNITGWKQTYNGVSSTECIVPNNELIYI